MEIMAAARRFMASTGNPGQWTGGYPQRFLMEREVGRGCCYVCVGRDGRVVGTFCLVEGPDPTYLNIYDGRWLDDEPYWVVHRLASDGSVGGLGARCIEWCRERCGNLRIDTHERNRVMRSLLERCGFVRCGIIHVADGSPRIAFQMPEEVRAKRP